MLEGRTHKAVVELFRTAGEEVELLIQKKVRVRSCTLRSERLTASYMVSVALEHYCFKLYMLVISLVTRVVVMCECQQVFINSLTAAS